MKPLAFVLSLLLALPSFAQDADAGVGCLTCRDAQPLQAADGGYLITGDALMCLACQVKSLEVEKDAYAAQLAQKDAKSTPALSSTASTVLAVGLLIVSAFVGYEIGRHSK